MSNSNLVYPQDATSGDYVAFDHVKYRSNRSGRTAAPPAEGKHIRLYMPPTTPPMTNGNSWNTMNTFEGEIGRGQLDLATAAGSADMDTGIDRVKQLIANNPAGRTKDMLYQGYVTGAAGLLQMDPNNVTQLGQGKIFNPNTELAYQGPQLRSFSLQFDFIPRNNTEVTSMDNIIMEFKKWSSASGANSNMYEVPELWSVTYVSGGKLDRMNRFKLSALKGVTVQANPSSDLHVTYTDGTPITTSLRLDFLESDVILREDHEAAGGQGF